MFLCVKQVNAVPRSPVKNNKYCRKILEDEVEEDDEEG